MPAESSVLVGLPADGRYGTTVYYGSGYATAQALVSALNGTVKEVRRSDTIASGAEGLEQAKEAGFDYYIEPRILHWEDRATAWSGRSDVIIVDVSVFKVSTGDEIDSVTINGKSQWFTFTNEPPSDLLAEPMRNYVADLVR